MMDVIIKSYEHFNKSLPNWDSPKGKYISSKKQYQEEMAKGGFVPYRPVEPKQKKWVPSEDLHRTLNEVKSMGDKKGNINLANNERLVEKMKSMGVKFEVNKDIMDTINKGTK